MSHKLEPAYIAERRAPGIMTVLTLFVTLWSTLFWAVSTAVNPIRDISELAVLSAGMAWSLGHWLSLAGSTAFLLILLARLKQAYVRQWQTAASIGVYLAGHMGLVLAGISFNRGVELTEETLYFWISQLDIYVWHATLPVLIYYVARREGPVANP